MCGYQGTTIAATPNGTTTINPPRPVFTWDDPRMQDPAKVCAPGRQPDPSDPGFAEYTVLMKRRAVLAAIVRQYPVAFKAVGEASPFGGGPYGLMIGWTDPPGTTSCTHTNPKVVQDASGNPSLPGAYNIAPASAWRGDDGVLHPGTKGHPAWVPYAPGKLPSVGDSYILTGAKEVDGEGGKKSFGRFLHVGTIVHVDVSADDAYWITADGGQKDPAKKGEAAHLVRRQFKCTTSMKSKPNAPHLSGGAEGGHRRVLGWLDIGDPRVTFETQALQRQSIEDEYRKCGAWIERALKG